MHQLLAVPAVSCASGSLPSAVGQVRGALLEQHHDTVIPDLAQTGRFICVRDQHCDHRGRQVCQVYSIELSQLWDLLDRLHARMARV